jgi:uncharacterized integral membrane protein
VVFRGVGFVWWFVVALPLAAALIVFVAQNTEETTVRWTVWKVRAPLIAVVLVTIFVAIVVAEIFGLVWRHRRRRTLAQRHSLRAAGTAGRAVPAGAPAEVRDDESARPARAGESKDDTTPPN